MSSLPWYKEGLKFKCTGCGKCCTGAPGFVFVTDEEIQEMASALKLDVKTFKIRYVRKRLNRLALVEKKNNVGGKDCIFLEGKACTLYQARPKQCRSYPWWPENLHTPESWKLAALHCEGIHDHAPLVSFAEIEKEKGDGEH